MYVTHDGGRTWRRRGPATERSTVLALYFLDEKKGWAAGAWTQESTGEPFVLRTRDGGATWMRSEIPMEGRSSHLFDPTGIAFVTPQHGTFRGLQIAGLPSDEELFFVTRDGGKTWKFSHGSLAPAGSRSELSVTRTRFMWKLDANRILMSADNGMTWTQAEGQPDSEQ
jgi:photosystem II stability/assembly factor-like uncharacterized protein